MYENSWKYHGKIIEVFRNRKVATLLEMQQDFNILGKNLFLLKCTKIADPNSNLALSLEILKKAV